tara:strand:- start:698 stop:2026 length:1329 start_codon:yes stop_codon:yes gene_type:complete
MSYTKTINRSCFSQSLNSFVEKIKKSCLGKENNSVYYADDGTPIISKYSLNTIRMLPVETREENIFKQIIVEFLLRSENLSGLSSDIFLSYFLDLLSLSKDSTFNSSKNTENIKIAINNLLLKPSLEDLKCFLDNNFEDLYSKAVFEALKSFGLNGRIDIKRKNCDKVIVETSKGFSFKCLPDENLLYFSKGKYDREKARAIVIDGIIEKVSELDRILNYAASTKHSIVIFCRGYTEEVLSTIMTNNMRGTIDVLLVSSKIDENSANDLSDICVCVGSKFCSVFSGQLITSIDPEEDFGIVDRLIVDPEKVTIINEKTQLHAKKRILDLIKKNHDNLDADYYKNRIKNLTGYTCTIYVPEKDEQKNVFMTSNFDATLRSAKSVISKGLVVPSNVACMDDIKLPSMSEFKNRIPAKSFFVGVEMANKCFEKIKSIEKLITIDQ